MLRKLVSMQRPRIYDVVLAEHLRKYRQMAFLTGPRQVCKTTLCRQQKIAEDGWRASAMESGRAELLQRYGRNTEIKGPGSLGRSDLETDVRGLGSGREGRALVVPTGRIESGPRNRS